MLLDEQCWIRKNNILATLPVVGKQYRVHFDVFPKANTKGLRNVIHFTAGGKGNKKYRDRIPAVFFQNFNQLYICSGVNRNRSYCQTGSKVTSRWSTVVIR